MAHTKDPHENVMDDLRLNGPGPVQADTLKVNPALRSQFREFGAIGLLDTLRTLTGASPTIDTLADVVKEPGLYGALTQRGQIELSRDLPRRLFTETLIHEFGHELASTPRRKVGISQRSLAAVLRGDTEELNARAFARAVLALRATAKDTTQASDVIEQFSLGIHPELSLVERLRGTTPNVRSMVRELLGQPIFRQHPLRPRKEEF